MIDRARSFDEAAALYADARPDYPQSALDWLLPADDPQRLRGKECVGYAERLRGKECVGYAERLRGKECVGARVLDLGAGTGKLTRQLVDAGFDVVAVEPSPQMGAELSAYVPEAELLEGGAEAIPLPDGAVDAVLAGQAFHWFDRERALPEIARVLRPGGRLGVLWNFDDDREAWVDALATITGSPSRANQRKPGVIEAEHFVDIVTADFPHGQQLDVDSLRQLVQTHSFYLVQDADGRADAVRRIEELVSTHPDLAGRDSFVLPYVTRCWRGTRR